MRTSDVDYIGVPYESLGEPPRSADCWTLCRWFAKRELGLSWPKYFYSMAEQTQDSVRLITDNIGGKHWPIVTERPLDLSLVKRGDVLIMTVAGHQQHCGICLDQEQFIHSLHGRNSTLERILRWKPNIDAVIRWRG